MQGTRELSDGSALAGTDDRTGRDAEATSHVDDETRLWPRPRLPGRAVENRRELQFQSDSTALCSTPHSQTTRTRATNAGRAAGSRSGGVSGAAAHPAQPWASTAAPGPGPPPAHPSPGGPHSVGSKSSFFQAKIGPVDGQSLSGLSSGIQTESVKTKSQTVTDGNSPHPSWCRQSLTTSLGGGGLSVPDPASRSPPYLATLQSGPREGGDPLLQDTGQCPQCPLVSCVLF